MASIEKRRGGYLVRWREKQPDGTRAPRSRKAPDYESAKALKREVEAAIALRGKWEPESATAVPTAREAFTAYIAWCETRKAPGTVRNFDTGLSQFYDWLRQRVRGTPLLTQVTNSNADAWYNELRKGPNALATCNLRAAALQCARTWLYDSDEFGEHTPRPRLKLQLPAVPWVPPRAPTWAQMDACIHVARGLSRTARLPRERRLYAWKADLFLFLRCTGLRVSQALHLRHRDVNLDAGQLTVRGELGKSRQERAGRTIPLSVHLLDELHTWDRQPDDWLIAPHKTFRDSLTHRTRRCWEATDAPSEVYNQPHHAFRYGFTSGLKMLKADSEAVEFLVGHATSGARSHYLDPSWALELENAVQLVPPLSPP